MPIFQADLDHERRSRRPDPGPIDIRPSSPKLRRLSEESLRTELCEGPVPDSPPYPSTPPRNSSGDGGAFDRTELIERLKRGDTAAWIPSRQVRSSAGACVPLWTRGADPGLQFESVVGTTTASVHAAKTSRSSSQSSGLLPPAQITPEKNRTAQVYPDERLQDGLSIERPRSALHSGDFTHDERQDKSEAEHGYIGQKLPRPVAQTPWIATSPPRDFTPFPFDHRASLLGAARSVRPAASPLSSSLSSSFAYQPPTSPLVQSESNDELDFSLDSGAANLSTGFPSSRRHTLHSSHSSPFGSPSPRLSMNTWTPVRRDGSLPYQAHQPRRSLNSTPSFLLSGSSPQTPALLRSRRPSLSSDASPIQHASMVGSYEESILRGRMSTTPSKPFDFLAQIGVLGKGKCKPTLRCPDHVTLPFPAVYYSYSSTPHGRSQSNDGPSPYVGQIDLENGLTNPDDELRLRRKAQTRYSERLSTDGDLDMAGSGPEVEQKRPSKPKRRSGSPKRPPGGSYRIPEKGQIQLIIKNPNKTAVKLFLVPYDLAGMEPGTKTFIRQRSYSAGPIIDHVPNLSESDSMSRPMLRYLVHLHICCPSKGRYYLYKSIRVVFANCVPEGKEKLRNETTWPEPRFTPYKPIRVMHPPASSSTGPAAMLAAEKAFRRRSLGVSFGGASNRATFDMLDGLDTNGHAGSGAASGNTMPIEPIPFRLPTPRVRGNSDISDSTGITGITGAGLRSPESSSHSRPSTKDSSGGAPWGAPQYEKLSKGDAGYGGYNFNGSPTGSGSPAGAESLLSQRLRSLGVKPKRSPPGAQED
ncbi:succinate dehydrogenase [Purpureocillium lavendulum]|uniref:Succinate dehydrogenase n=1 Tax=Purpureocillium lavendulum TaxID=1247861 RepID=A0AB34G6C9_9HYPO|nr:succinate dehydrogenase [Purpureocillium lavendulum]